MFKYVDGKVDNYKTLFYKPCCQAQFQFSASQVELRLAILSLSVHPPTHQPTRASIFEPLLDYLGTWNFVWKFYLTKLGQLAI